MLCMDGQTGVIHRLPLLSGGFSGQRDLSDFLLTAAHHQPAPPCPRRWTMGSPDAFCLPGRRPHQSLPLHPLSGQLAVLHRCPQPPPLPPLERVVHRSDGVGHLPVHPDHPAARDCGRAGRHFAGGGQLLGCRAQGTARACLPPSAPADWMVSPWNLNNQPQSSQSRLDGANAFVQAAFFPCFLPYLDLQA